MPAVLLLALTAFLAGGVYSLARQGHRGGAAVVGVMAALSLLGAGLWAWQP